MDVDLVAKEVMSLAHGENGEEGPFLLARLITAQLLEEPVDTADPDWRKQLARTVEDALDRDLSRSRPLKRDEQELPQAGRELLTALAYSYGSGFPDDVWPEVATAISPTDTHYTRHDAFWALTEHGRYVTASGQSGQAVYRLHERLASSLRTGLRERREDWDEETARREVGQAILAAYARFLEQGSAAAEHAYLWLYAWRHAADAGIDGIARLEELAGRDTALLPDVGMAFTHLGELLSDMGRAEEAVEVGERGVAAYERVAELDPALEASLAQALSNLGVHYSEFGRKTAAVEPTERAVEIYKRLAHEQSSYLPELAMATGNLGNRYAEVGRWNEALDLTTQALKLHEELSKHDSAYLKELAASLSNIGNRYDEVGRSQDAVAPAERAVELYEELARDDLAFRREVVHALNNLGVRYSDVGRFKDAVKVISRAIELGEEIVEENPAYAGALAAALGNLGATYKMLGLDTDALSPTERAVEIYEGLAAANPAFLGELSGSLNNLGIRYSALGRYEEAAVQTEKATQIRSELAKDNPAYLGDLASSLNNLSNRYVNLGRRSAAIDLSEQSVSIYDRLAKDNAAYLNNLAMALVNLGHRYRLVDRANEAVAPVERSVRIREKLVEENPAVRVFLAESLDGLAVVFIDLKQPERALEPTQRAIEIYEELRHENSAVIRDLSTSLDHLGTIYARLGRHEEALEATVKVVELREEMAQQNPALLSGLASALNNLASRYAALDRQDEAKEKLVMATEIYEDLMDTYPGALEDLALTLSNLSNLEDDETAIRLLERAEAIYTDLTEEEPSHAKSLAETLNKLWVTFGSAGQTEKGREKWDAAFEHFDEPGSAAVALRLHRFRRPEEREEGIGDVIAAVLLSGDQSGGLLFQLHGSCRAMRSSNHEIFDSRWEETIGDLPAWLLLDESMIRTCWKWIETGDWAQSLKFLEEHDELLGEQGLTTLAEIMILSPDSDSLRQHLQILEVAREQGVQAAYEPIVVEQMVLAWLRLREPQDSKDFLLEHRDVLLRKEAIAAAVERNDRVHVALLTLSASGEQDQIDKAYQLLLDPETHREALAAARAEDDLRRLGATAVLCETNPKDADDAAEARLHLVMAMAMEGEMEQAERAAQAIEATPGPLIEVLTDAIARHPRHAKELAELIRIVSAQESEGAREA